MKTRILALAIATAFVISMPGCWFWNQNKQVTFKTSNGTHSFQVEVADTTEARSKGLMERESLGEDKGMIFIYTEEKVPGFWMKNMKISLDMIFMDKDFKVVDYFENVPPCTKDPCAHYIPSTPSQYILEVNAGVARKIMLAKGDIAEYK